MRLRNVEKQFSYVLFIQFLPGILLINQNIADMIRYIVDANDKTVPAVLEIPSKDHPYNPTKDSILHRARGMFNADDFR